MQAKEFPKQALDTVTPHRVSGFFPHTDAQPPTGLIARAVGRKDQAEALPVPPFAFMVDPLEFSVQMQAHPAGKGADARHGITAPVVCGPWLAFF